MRYVNLHTHTTFSYGDGYGTVDQHVKRVASLGMTALALTEHGNTSSWVQLEKSCAARGVKPIYGCEIYYAPPYQPRKFHMTLLAMNNLGMANLNAMITESTRSLIKDEEDKTTSKSRFPTVHPKVLREYHEGIIALSGCASSQLACVLLGGKSHGDERLELRPNDIANGIRLVEKYQAVFDDRWYLEVQRFPDLERIVLLNKAITEISRQTGARIVATSDVHYPFPKQNALQKILHASHRGGTVESVEQEWEYNVILSYPRSDEEIWCDLEATGLTGAQADSAITETARIADRCNATLPKVTPPKYIVGPNDWEPWI